MTSSALQRSDSRHTTRLRPVARAISGKRVTADDAAIGRRVRGRRLERGLSQTAVAEMVGVTFQQLQKYEKGVNRISSTMLVRLAGALEAHPVYLLGLATAAPETSLAERMIATRQGCAMATFWLRIGSASKRQALLDTAQLLAEVTP